MSQTPNADQELLSSIVACQLVIKQILDVLGTIAPVEVQEKISSQLKSIDSSNHPAGTDPVTMRVTQKAVTLTELKFTPQNESHQNRPLFQVLEEFFLPRRMRGVGVEKIKHQPDKVRCIVVRYQHDES